jgi:hypothetical protein
MVLDPSLELLVSPDLATLPHLVELVFQERGRVMRHGEALRLLVITLMVVLSTREMLWSRHCRVDADDSVLYIELLGGLGV